MVSELDVLRDLSQKLIAAELPFMVTGSMAMNAYAEPRMTRDIDLVISVQLAEFDKLVKAFEHDYLFSPDALFDAVRKNSMINFIHSSSLIKVDFIFQKKTQYRQLEFERRQKLKLTDFETFLVSKEDLILSKLEWSKESHSEIQAKDIRNLLTAGELDQEYLEQWAKNLGLSDYLRKVRGEE